MEFSQIKHRHGFTLIEMVIVIVLLIVLSSMILGSTLRSTFQKGRDSKRKQDLSKLVSYFEDYSNDHRGYPPENPAGTIDGAPWGGPFFSTGGSLPQDPLSPSREYYYQTDPTRQNMFVVYALLENESDNDIARTGCAGGCGPGRAYNFAVYSPNVVMVDGQPVYEGTTLGVSTGPDTWPFSPIGNGCRLGQCGYCRRCGGANGSDCGSLTRCTSEGKTAGCYFDLGCISK